MLIILKTNSQFVINTLCCSLSAVFLFVLIYHKVLIISPGLIFVQKAFLLGLFSGELFSEGLAFQNGLGLTIKTT